jgi:hypothetical protein
MMAALLYNDMQHPNARQGRILPKNFQKSTRCQSRGWPKYANVMG